MKKVVIITGASSGIGLETAKLLADKGYTVYGIARSDFNSEKFTFYKCDVCNKARMAEIFEEIYQKEGTIDVVINNAGIGISGAIEYVNPSDVEKQFSVNVLSVINTCSLAIKYLRKSKGKIINISSVAGVVPIPFQACYSASKAAIESFSFALANELKPQKISVTCVRPGDTKTGFTSARIKTEIEDEVYNNRIKKSVAKMEKDEQNGAPPIKVSKLIYKCIKRKRPPLATTVGFGYKLICLLVKIFPVKFVNWIVYRLY